MSEVIAQFSRRSQQKKEGKTKDQSYQTPHESTTPPRISLHSLSLSYYVRKTEKLQTWKSHMCWRTKQPNIQTVIKQRGREKKKYPPIKTERTTKKKKRTFCLFMLSFSLFLPLKKILIRSFSPSLFSSSFFIFLKSCALFSQFFFLFLTKSVERKVRG